MKSLSKTVPYILILVVLMFLLGCIGQGEDPSELTVGSTSFNDSKIPYEGPDVLVQAGNFRPKNQFWPLSSFQIVADIRLGAGIYSSYTWRDLPNFDRTLNNIIEYGAWRVDTCVDEVEGPIYWEYNCDDEFPKEYDQFIDGLHENGVTVNYMLHFWDKTGHANGEELSTPRFQTEEQIQDFLNYTRFVVRQYKDRIRYYTIWSEPDNCGGAGDEEGIKCIWVEDYINLVRRTVPVIHEEDPQAKVSIAPVVLYFAREYLSAILKSDIMTMVDVLQWHGIYNVLPNDPFFEDYYYQYPAIVEVIRQTATAHGFDGEYWATEISYSAEGNPPDQPWGTPRTGKEAAKYALRAIVMHLGWNIGVAMNTWLPDVIAPWLRPTTSNLYKVLTGTKPISLAARLYRPPPNTVTNTFELPNGDILFALWTHGEAVHDDPGLSTTLTFPGLSAQQVIAIDVLNGFEQELIIEVWSGNLVIRNLFVRDYPLILRITNPSPGSPIAIALISGLIIGIPIIVVSVYFIRKRRIR